MCDSRGGMCEERTERSKSLREQLIAQLTDDVVDRFLTDRGTGD